MPLLSIIVTTYNRPLFLKRAIESVVEQSNADLELIVIDDGSSPSAESIVSNFNDQRIQYIFQKNKGRSAARNHGMNLAKGEYICFLDDDDIYDKDFCQNLAQEKDNEDVLVFAYKMGKITAKDLKLYSPGKAKEFKSLFARRTYAPSAFVIKRTSLGSAKFLEDSFLGEDFQFFMNFILAKKIKTVDSVSSTMTIHSNNTTNSKYTKFKDSVYPQLKVNVLDLLERNKMAIGISESEYKLIRDNHIQALLKGHAMHDLTYTKSLLNTISRDFPGAKLPRNFDLSMFRVKGMIKSILGR